MSYYSLPDDVRAHIREFVYGDPVKHKQRLLHQIQHMLVMCQFMAIVGCCAEVAYEDSFLPSWFVAFLEEDDYEDTFYSSPKWCEQPHKWWWA